MKEDSKIRVVLAINDFLIGGAEQLIVDQLEYFNQDKFDFYLITLFDFPSREDFYFKLPRDIKLFKLNFSGFFDFKEWFKLIKILRKINPDIVRSSLFFSNTIFSFLKLFFRYQIICAIHNTYKNRKKWQIVTERFLSRFVFKMVTDSQGVLDFNVAQTKIPADKYQVIYNGINLDSINDFLKNSKPNTSELLKELSITTSGKIFLNISRLTEQKDHSLLIDSFYEYSKINSEDILIIVGGGALHQELLSKIRALNLGGRVILTGYRTDIYRFYDSCDIFVLSSKIEGFSLAALEAMAFGKPVVSTKVAGPTEYVKDGFNGYLVDSDPISISEKMKILSEKIKSEKHLLEANCKSTADRFDIKRNAEEYEKLFELACARK